MDIAELITILAPPAAEQRIAVPGDWTEEERLIGLALPKDYRDFLETYGTGTFARGFVMFAVPEPASGPGRLSTMTASFTDAYRSLKESWPARYTLPLAPAAGGFMPFARTENGDYLGWIVREGDPEDWTTAIIASDEGRPQVFDVDMPGLMAGLTNGQIVPKAFPDSFSQRERAFRPSP